MVIEFEFIKKIIIGEVILLNGAVLSYYFLAPVLNISISFDIIHLNYSTSISYPNGIPFWALFYYNLSGKIFYALTYDLYHNWCGQNRPADCKETIQI